MCNQLRDYFSNLTLRGNYDSFNRAANRKTSKTPELTNTGSFEKCWKLKNGEWWMHKWLDIGDYRRYAEL